MVPKKILCPIDFSEVSEKSLRYAVHLAKTMEADLTVMHVSNDFFGASPESRYYTSAMSSFLSDIRQLRNQIRELRDIHCNSYHCLGSPPHEIVDYAEKESFDLIVIGSHNRKRLAKLFWGSVTEKVVQNSHSDVLIISPDQEEFSSDFSAVDSRIVVPYDFSDACDFAVEYAVSVSKDPANVFAVHISEPISTSTRCGLSPTQEEAGIRIADRKEFRDRMERLGLGNVGFKTFFSTDIPSRIKMFAEDSRAKLIVLPSRQHNLFERFFIGTTSRNIAQVSTCPVLLLKNFAGASGEVQRSGITPTIKSVFR